MPLSAFPPNSKKTETSGVPKTKRIHHLADSALLPDPPNGNELVRIPYVLCLEASEHTSNLMV